MSPQQAIRKEYGKSANFVTPDVISYGWIRPGRLAFEISTGRGFNHDELFGLSVVIVTRHRPKQTRRARRLSDCFHSKRALLRELSRLRSLMPEEREEG